MSDLLSHFDSQIQGQEQLLREREQEIEQLRRQRDRLAELEEQRDELHTQLRTVESEIATVERTMTSSLHRVSSRFEGGALAPASPPAPSPRLPEPPLSPPAPRVATAPATPRTAPAPLPPPAPRTTPVASPTPAPRTTPAAGTASEPKTSSLKDEIKKVLRTARGALSGPVIADKILAAGYKTSSANFANIVKKHLSEMEEVSHVRGEGYKLKK